MEGHTLQENNAKKQRNSDNAVIIQILSYLPG